MPEPPDVPGCDLCGDQGPLLLQARCHLTAPLAITLHGNTLIVSCYLPDCRREVARFEVARGSLPLRPSVRGGFVNPGKI